MEKKISRKKQKEKLETVGAFEIYRFADKLDVFLVIIGFIGALVSGIVFPLMFITYGKLTDATTKYMFAFNNPLTPCDNCEIGCPEADKQLNDEMIAIFWELCTLGGAMWLGQYIYSVALNTSALRQTMRIRKEFLKGILRQDVGWYDTTTTNDFVVKMIQDLNKIQNGIGENLGMMLRYALTCFGSVGFAFYMNWHVAIILFPIAPIIAIFKSIANSVITKTAIDQLKVSAKAGAVAEEALGAIRTVVAFGGEKNEVEKYSVELMLAKGKGILRSILSSSSMGLSFAVMSIFEGVSLWYGVKLIKDEEEYDEDFQNCKKTCYTDGTITHMIELKDLPNCIDECRVYTIGSVTTAFMGIVQGTMQIAYAGMFWESLHTARASAYSIFQMIDRKSLIDIHSSDGEKPEKLSGNFTFKNVYFNYPARKEVNVLQDFTLEIEENSTVALVGGSGCGKSTCIQLIQRFYDPDGGSVAIDGIDIKKLNIGWFRDRIGIVGQEPVLFNCTIGENIRYAKPNATDEEIMKACKDSNAYEFIQKLPLKYDTMVGEGGTQLSGGQKQRIAIARALINDPRILLLDEATSALDNGSEAIVQSALDRAQKGRTTIVVAHRLSTVRNADCIVALKDGKVAEKGTHEELMALNGLYHSLVESQLAPKGDYEGTGEKETIKDLERPMTVKERRLSRQMSKQFCSQTSITLSNVEENVETVEEHTNRVSLFVKLVKLNSPEAGFIAVGIIAAMVFGCVPPMFGVLFGSFVSVLSEPHDEALEAAKIFAIEFAGMGVVFFVTLCMQGIMFGIAGERLVERVRRRMFESMLNQEIGWFDEEKNNTGALSSRLSHNAQQLGDGTGQKLGQTLGGFTTLVFATSVGFYYNWKLGLVAFATLLPLLFTIMMKGRVMMSNYRTNMKSLGKSSKIALEAISNVRTIYGLRCEDLITNQFAKALEDSQKISNINNQYGALILAFSSSNMFFSYAICYYYGIYLITHSCPDEIPIDQIIKVAIAVLNGGMFAGMVFQHLIDFCNAFAAAEPIFEILDRKPDIDNNPAAGLRLNNINGKVDVQNGNFCYPTRKTRNILRNLTLGIKKGEKIGLVGQSGCGKSTIIHLIQRFYDLNIGAVNVDDYNIQSLNVPLMRSKLGIVTQEPVLFNRTIAENIKYGDITRNVSIEEVIEAAKKSNIHNFVKNLPQGYDTNVGGKGTKLSGGQKQRIAIARALVR